MSTHLEESLQRDADLIRKKITEMGELVVASLESSLQALTENNRELAYSVILRDRYIDELEKELDRLCLEFIVRQQPVAGHLRFVYASIKINNELERVGDYAESIARQYLAISDYEHRFSDGKISQIAQLSIPMVKNALLAFTRQNPELAKSTIAMEDKVDEARTSAHDSLIKRHERDELPLEALSPLMIIASRFERAADQATNICEEVLYMTTGQNIKHQGKEVSRVLFVDEHDACRGQMALGIADSIGIEGFHFNSAGISPTEIDKKTVDFMEEKDIDISHQTSKYLNQILNLDHYAVIVSLCKEAEVALPPAPTKTVSIRWKVKDPSQVQGTEEEIQAAYEKTYKYLDTHIRDLIQAIRGESNHE